VPFVGRLVVQEIVFLSAMIAALALMARIERRSRWSFGLAERRIATRSLLGVALGTTVLAAFVAVLELAGFARVSPSGDPLSVAAIYGVLWFALFALVALAEELFFRGYLLVTLARGIGFWPAAIVLSIAFGLAHVANAGEGPIGAISAGTSGLMLAFAFYRSGSLWFPIGIHAGWDWAQSWVFGTADSGMHISHSLLHTTPLGNVLQSGGSIGPEGSIFSFAIDAIFIGVTLVAFRPRTSIFERATSNA